MRNVADIPGNVELNGRFGKRKWSVGELEGWSVELK